MYSKGCQIVRCEDLPKEFVLFFASGVLENKGHERDEIFVETAYGGDLNVKQRKFLSDCMLPDRGQLWHSQKCLCAMFNVNYNKNKPFK